MKTRYCSCEISNFVDVNYIHLGKKKTHRIDKISDFMRIRCELKIQFDIHSLITMFSG